MDNGIEYYVSPQDVLFRARLMHRGQWAVERFCEDNNFWVYIYWFASVFALNEWLRLQKCKPAGKERVFIAKLCEVVL